LPDTKDKICSQILHHLFDQYKKCRSDLWSRKYRSQSELLQSYGIFINSLKYFSTAFLVSALFAPALLVYPASADDLFPVLVRGIEKSMPAGWSIDGKPYQYDNVTLYTYIDGGADMFLKHGFKQLTGAVCKSPSHSSDSVTIDIYVLSSEQNAAALFGRKKSGKTLQLKGAGEACEGKGYLCMYKGRFYVELQASGSASSEPSFMRQIVESLIRNLP